MMYVSVNLKCIKIKKYSGENIRVASYKKVSAIGVRCYLITSLAFGLVEYMILYIISRNIYFIVTRILGHT